METGQMADLLRRVRHDFANHLQVISGYLDIGQPQQARAYLRQAVDEMNSARIILEQSNSEAALYFYEQLQRAHEMGYKIRLQNTPSKHWEALRLNDEPLRTLADLSRDGAWGFAEEEVFVSFGADDEGVEISFTFPGREGFSRVIRVNKE